jgi:hypothetical protein
MDPALVDEALRTGLITEADARRMLGRQPKPWIVPKTPPPPPAAPRKEVVRHGGRAVRVRWRDYA